MTGHALSPLILHYDDDRDLRLLFLAYDKFYK